MQIIFRELFGCQGLDASPAISNFYREYSEFLKLKENASLVQVGHNFTKIIVVRSLIIYKITLMAMVTFINELYMYKLYYEYSSGKI